MVNYEVRSQRRRWSLLAAVMVAGVALFLAARFFLEASDPLAPVIAAARNSYVRPIEARIAGFPYGAAPSPESGGGQAPFALRSAAARLLEKSRNPADRSYLHATGVAALIGGGPAAAEKLLEAAQREPAQARYWNDAAAALHTRARAETNAHDLVRALAAADTALRYEPDRGDARFNRALILETLGLRQHAAAAWNAYLAVDAGSPWAGEARQRAASLMTSQNDAPRDEVRRLLGQPNDGAIAVLRPLVTRFPEETRRHAEVVTLANWGTAFLRGDRSGAASWLADARTAGSLLFEKSGESLLMEAVAAIDRCASGTCGDALAAEHVRYDRARQLYGKREIARALPLFQSLTATFERIGSPMSRVTRLYAISCREDLGEPGLVEEIEREISSTPLRYEALRAQLSWSLGTACSRIGRTADALAAYLVAMNAFERLGEKRNANYMRSFAAGSHAFLGQPLHAWRLRQLVLVGFSRAGAGEDLEKALELAGRTEIANQNWSAAWSLFQLAKEMQFNARTQVSARLWSALAAHRAGWKKNARHELGDARRYAWRIDDESLRHMALDDLSFAEASVLRESDPTRAGALLDRFIESVHARGRTFRLSDAYLERARSARGAGDMQGAERFYRAAISEVDLQRSDSVERGVIDSYFATGSAAVRELVDQLEAQGRVEDAFAVLELGRGRALLERLGKSESVEAPAAASAIRQRMAAGTLLASYLVLDDRLLIFSIGSERGLRVDRVTVTAQEVRRTIADLRRALAEEDEGGANDAAQRLHDFTVAPLAGSIRTASLLAIVADPLLEPVPFALLRDRRDGRHLIERVPITTVPSASLLVRSSIVPPAGTGVTIFGDPAIDRARFPSLSQLPAAAREAKDIAAQYPAATLSIGRDATASRFLRELGASRLVHLAAHAVLSRDPSQSVLVFAPAGTGSGALYAGDIARTECKADVVVLAGCRTAAPAESASDINSLALAFFAAGARNVVGTLTNVDDEAAAEFSRLLHASLRRGASPAGAVRASQMQMMRGRKLRAWSAFTLTGRGI